MVASELWSSHAQWQTAEEYIAADLDLTTDKFFEVTNLLIEKPNLNSTHLFRADILFDSAGILQTTAEKEKERNFCSNSSEESTETESSLREYPQPEAFEEFVLERRVVRRLIPRKPNLDAPLIQTCSIYSKRTQLSSSNGHLVVYQPHADKEDEIPWYHPPVKALAYLTEGNESSGTAKIKLSIHFLPYSPLPDPFPTRLHRTFLSLLQTFTRLVRYEGSTAQPESNPTSKSMPVLSASALKDTILPQHVVQDTYTRLKQQYASDMISRWIEKTDPAKHVFEDLSIAAFLIELWKQMYREREFPGFIDIACGNGVLVYILIKEGYNGCGFDARRRKTWDILGIDDYLEEKIYVPEAFVTAIQCKQEDSNDLTAATLSDMVIHNGMFSPGTFIISNHADQLTPWTPIMAISSNPQTPLPFLAIPCCSHALSGAKYRYPVEEKLSTEVTDEQPASGDLKALRAAKVKAANHTDSKSTYACLTKKVVSLAQEIGCQTELTLMRIPSTRNIGIVGNRYNVSSRSGRDTQSSASSQETTEAKVYSVIERECKASGGVDAAARIWMEGVQKLQTGKGRGKVNLGGKIEHD